MSAEDSPQSAYVHMARRRGERRWEIRLNLTRCWEWIMGRRKRQQEALDRDLAEARKSEREFREWIDQE